MLGPLGKPWQLLLYPPSLCSPQRPGPHSFVLLRGLQKHICPLRASLLWSSILWGACPTSCGSPVHVCCSPLARSLPSPAQAWPRQGDRSKSVCRVRQAWKTDPDSPARSPWPQPRPVPWLSAWEQSPTHLFQGLWLVPTFKSLTSGLWFLRDQHEGSWTLL